MRTLLELLNDYVRLKEVEARRLALAGRNSLARRLLELLDLEAGQQQQAVTLEAAAAAAHQQQAAAAAVAQQVQQVQPLPAFVPVQQSGGNGFGQPAPHLHPLDLAAAPGQQQHQQQQHGGTPGRHRKGQPRKRQRLSGGDAAAAAAAAAADGLGPPGMGSGGLFGDGGGSGAGWGSPTDILNQPLDAVGLEALLDEGPLQVGVRCAVSLQVSWRLSARGRPAATLDGWPLQCFATALCCALWICDLEGSLVC